jgi:hypothetical protein
MIILPLLMNTYLLGMMLLRQPLVVSMLKIIQVFSNGMKPLKQMILLQQLFLQNKSIFSLL